MRDRTVLSSGPLAWCTASVLGQEDWYMKRSVIALTVLLSGAVALAQRGGPTPEMQAALAKQEALEKSTPRLQVAEEVLQLAGPNHTIGETVGGAQKSKGDP